MVLCALLLIFFYLLYVVKPVFHSAHIEQKEVISDLNKKYATVSIEEQNEIAFALTETGAVDFYSVDGKNKGELIHSEQVEFNSQPVIFKNGIPHQGLYAYVNQENALTIVKPFFRVSFPGNKRLLTPVVNYPFGEEAMSLGDNSMFEVKDIAFAVSETSVGAIYQLANQQVLFTKILGEENMFTEEIEWTTTQVELNMVRGNIKGLHISPDLSRAFVVTEKQLFVIDTRDETDVNLLYSVNINRQNAGKAQVTSSALLAGANSLMIGYSDGKISQWFETNSDSGRAFINSRSFQMETENAKQSVVQLIPEYYRRTFAAVTPSGEVNLFHTTSEAELWQGRFTDKPLHSMAFSPRSNAIVALSNGSLVLLDVENEHPEVSWSGIWQEVWYEGYPEASYTWQSSSASDDFESKFSLVPISFGTLKAAMYAMLFAVPIGLAAAVYTAYFMAPNVRQIVKPTVEIMEALPTVILGFLAGLWLAPVIEENLPGVILLLIMLPIAIFITAFVWFKLPRKIKESMPTGWDSIILLPVVAIVGYASFALSPAVEQWLFDGNTRLYITNELGITFDQRNSLIVGIAMGFAVIPTIFSIAEDAVFSVPKTLSSGSLALGATQWQTLVKVVLLTASPGIFSAVMMGLGRAVGETMIVLMATGNTPIMDWSIFEGMRTLSANIAVEMPESEVGSSHYRILFLAAFVLFIFTFVFNTLAEFVRQRLREKYSSL
ncbi:MAG: ABC transporter permease subunit [Gammaproteobacteria bacterium]|nr:ABC transporter permease subunit [Gammaproteobacteria bacterium]